MIGLYFLIGFTIAVIWTFSDEAFLNELMDEMLMFCLVLMMWPAYVFHLFHKWRGKR